MPSIPSLKIKSSGTYSVIHIYSQTLRVKRVCSKESDFKEHSSKLESWFLKTDYPEKIINTEMKKGDTNRQVNNKTEKR